MHIQPWIAHPSTTAIPAHQQRYVAGVHPLALARTGMKTVPLWEVFVPNGRSRAILVHRLCPAMNTSIVVLAVGTRSAVGVIRHRLV